MKDIKKMSTPKHISFIPESPNVPTAVTYDFPVVVGLPQDKRCGDLTAHPVSAKMSRYPQSIRQIRC